MRCIWKRYDALATDCDTGSASGVRVFILFVDTLLRLVTSRLSLLGISAQIQGAGEPASNSILYSPSHNFDSVAEIAATVASATVSYVAGTIGTEASLSV